jgi:predicted methyltransferase
MRKVEEKMTFKHYENTQFLSESINFDTYCHSNGEVQALTSPFSCNKKKFRLTDKDEWKKPKEVISAMGIKENTLIAEIGPDDGYFLVKFAKKATNGYVYGIVIQQNMIQFFSKLSEFEGLINLESKLGESDDPLIPEPVDIIFIENAYHHIENRIEYFQNLKKYFLRNGKLVIVDFKNGTNPFGPSDGVKLAKKQIIEELKTAGYSLRLESSVLPYEYILIFTI